MIKEKKSNGSFDKLEQKSAKQKQERTIYECIECNAKFKRESDIERAETFGCPHCGSFEIEPVGTNKASLKCNECNTIYTKQSEINDVQINGCFECGSDDVTKYMPPIKNNGNNNDKEIETEFE